MRQAIRPFAIQIADEIKGTKSAGGATTAQGSLSMPAARASSLADVVAVQLKIQPARPTSRVLIVDAQGEVRTVAAAIQRAQPGDHILIRPGTYEERVTVDKPLFIEGDGPLGEVIIKAVAGPALILSTLMARVRNLSFQQGTEAEAPCVEIAHGAPELSECRIDCGGSIGVVVRAGASPSLRENRIEGGKVGVLLESSAGNIEDNNIFGQQSTGVGVAGKSTPRVRRNLIYGGAGCGLLFFQGAMGTVERNEIFDNALGGMRIGSSASPVVRDNVIAGNGQSGVFVFDGGVPLIEENTIERNAQAGVSVKGSSPRVIRNRITHNQQAAVMVFDRGNGTYEGNDLRENGGGAWDLYDTTQLVERSGNLE